MLTTSTQTAAESYTVTVAVTVMDTLGQPIDAAANTAMFAGFTPPSTTTIVINEIDYDQPGGDDAEFVELFNAGTTAVPLAGMELVFINGSSDVVYNTVDLSSAGTLAPGGYLLVSNSVTGPAAVPVVPLGMSRTIQNGGPDGVALVNTTSMTLVDALSYEGSITMAMILSGAVDLVSGTATSAADSNSVPGSLARIPNGARSGNDDADWSFEATPTPGAAN